MRYFVLILIISILSYLLYKKHHETNSFVDKISYLESDLKTYKDKYGNEVSTRQSLAGDKSELKLLLSKQIDSTKQFKELAKRYKRIKGAGTVTTKFIIDTVYIPFERPVSYDFIRTFNVDNPYYSINGNVNQLGVNIKNITIPNKFTFVMGERKNGFFKPNTYAIDVKNSNPFIQNTSVDSYIFTPEKKMWSFGPYIGFDVFNANISAGISLQYSLIQF